MPSNKYFLRQSHPKQSPRHNQTAGAGGETKRLVFSGKKIDPFAPHTAIESQEIDLMSSPEAKKRSSVDGSADVEPEIY